MIPDYTNPQAFNRYSYVGNNPVNFSDPTGHYACGDGEEKECGTGKKQNPNKNPHPNWSPTKKTGDGDDNENNDEEENCKGLKCLNSSDDNNVTPPIADSNPCAHGWVSALLTSDGSCGHVEVNPNAIVDPLAWEHIAGGILGGVVLMGFSLIMINLSVDLCLGSVPAGALGCVVGIPMGLAGVAGVAEGGVLVWSGLKFAGQYLDEVFEVKP